MLVFLHFSLVKYSVLALWCHSLFRFVCHFYYCLLYVFSFMLVEEKRINHPLQFLYQSETHRSFSNGEIGNRCLYFTAHRSKERRWRTMPRRKMKVYSNAGTEETCRYVEKVRRSACAVQKRIKPSGCRVGKPRRALLLHADQPQALDLIEFCKKRRALAFHPSYSNDQLISILLRVRPWHNSMAISK